MSFIHQSLKYLLLAVVVLVSTVNVHSFAYAEDWSSVIKTTESNIAVDMDSYDESKGYPSITTSTQYKKPQTIHINNHNLSYIEKRATPLFNCQTHAIKLSRVEMLDKKGKKIANEIAKDQFSPIETGSIDAQIESLVCQVHKMVGGM